MCGFLVQLSAQAVPAAAEPASAALSAVLVHRGQDDFQTLARPRYRVWSWRLALVDRVSSRQPMRAADGGVTVVFNGEIYNYRDLRAELQAAGVAFRTDGDTEVALEAYRHWGEACFARFDGMFALCVVDERAERLILARDPLGIKPLYFCHGRDALWAASEPKALLTGARIPPVLDHQALDEYWLFQAVLGTKTLFRSIQKVPPGCVAEFNLATQAPIGVRPIAVQALRVPATYDEAVEATRETLCAAARATFDTDLPLTFHLSGGLDSNLLVSLFRRMHPGRPVVGLSSLIEGEQDPEWPHIRRFAALHGCRLETTTVDAPAFFAALDDALYYLDEPAGDPGVVPQFLVNKLCAQRGKIVMTGHGLDELFFGYIRNLAAAILAEDGPEAITASSARFAALPPPTRSFFAGWEDHLRSLAPQDGEAPTLSYFRKLCRVDPFGRSGEDGRFAQRLRRLAGDVYDGIAREAPEMGAFMLEVESRIQLPPLLHMEDRASMRHTVEARVPFCHSSVLALARAVPGSWKLRNRTPKGLIREAVRDLVPPAVLARQEKVGRPVPLHRWMREPAGRPFREQLEAKRELFRDLTSCDLLARATDTTRPYDRVLWGLLSLARWIELYRVSV